MSNYKPGDDPPESYTDWFAWAEVQYKGNLDQTPCPLCNKWRFPQELEEYRQTKTSTIFRCKGGCDSESFGAYNG